MILVTVINNLNMITKIQTNLLLLNNEIFNLQPIETDLNE